MPLRDTTTMSSKPLIADELLAFIDYVKDTMDEISIIQICKSSFSEEEICSSKVLLYELLGKTAQMPTRRRDERGERSLQDIISLLKVTDPDDVPAFCARRLRRLPPVSFDHVDVTSLLKDITALKSSLVEMKFRLEASETTISELRTELLSLKNDNCVSRSPVASNINIRRGAQNVSVASFESAKFDASPAAAVTQDPPRPAARSTAPVELTSTSTPTRAYATVAAAAAADTATTAAASTASKAPAESQCRKKRKRRKQQRHDEGDRDQLKSVPRVALSVPSKGTVDEEGFTRVERRKKRPPSRNQCGTAVTGSNHLLRPAIPTTQIYVSRLFHSTKAEEVIEYVRVKTNLTLRVVKLESRHNVNFASFVVRVPTEKLATFMEANFWPKGVMYRRFRGTIRDTLITRNTSQSQRVT